MDIFKMFFPRNTAGSPSDTAGSLSNTTGSPSDTIGSLSNTTGSPSDTIGSLSNIAGNPSDTIGSLSNIAGSPSDTIGSPSDTAGSLSNTTGSPSDTDDTNVITGVAFQPITNIENANIPVFIKLQEKQIDKANVSLEPDQICVILDTSGSMGRAAKELQQQIPQILKDAGLSGIIPYTLITFATNCNKTQTTLLAAGTEIDNNGGGTNMAGVAGPLAEFLQSTNKFTLIIVISDGDLCDTDKAVKCLAKVVEAHPNPNTCVIGIRWGNSGDTRALSCIMALNASSSSIITVQSDINYTTLNEILLPNLLSLINNRICISGASKLPGENHTDISCLNQEDGMLVFVDKEYLSDLCANGKHIDISFLDTPIPKDILEKFCDSFIAHLRIQIVANLGMTEPIAQKIKALIELIDCVLGTPIDLSAIPLESTKTETRLERLVNNALAKNARLLQQLADMTDLTVRDKLLNLQRISKLDGLTSSKLNEFLNGRSVCTSRGIAERSKSADAIIEDMRESILKLCDAIRTGTIIPNSESEHPCIITHETCGAAYAALAQLPLEVIDGMPLEDLIEFLGTLPGLPIKCKKGDYANPWRAIVEVYNIKLYISTCGLAYARKNNKEMGGNGKFCCPTLGDSAEITGTVPMAIACGPFLKELRKLAPGVMSLLAGFNLRGLLSSVPGDGPALIAATMVAIWVSYCKTGMQSTIMKEQYDDLKSQNGYAYFADMVDKINKNKLAAATNAGGVEPLKLIAAVHYGAPEELHTLLLRIGYILDASDAFRRWVQGNGQTPPTRLDGLNSRDGALSDIFGLDDPKYNASAGEPFSPDPACPIVAIADNVCLNLEWLPCTDRYIDLNGNPFNTGESAVVGIVRAITDTSEKVRATHPSPGEGTTEWALTFLQSIITERFNKKIKAKRAKEEDITFNNLAKELSAMPYGHRFIETLCNNCPARSHSLFEKLLNQLTVDTYTAIDIPLKLWAMLTGHDKETGEAILFDGKLGLQWLCIFTKYLLLHNVAQEVIDTARKDWAQLYGRIGKNYHGHCEEFPSYHALTNGAAKSAKDYYKMYPLLEEEYRKNHPYCCGNSEGTPERRAYLREIYKERIKSKTPDTLAPVPDETLVSMSL